MSAPLETSAGTAAIRPFTVPVTTKAELEALRARITATRWPDQEFVADHSQGPKLAVMQELAPLLGDGIRLAPVRGETERPAPLHHRDRRAGHPLHPRPLRTRQRAAGHHHPRVARLDHRAAGGHRPADQSHRPRRQRSGRLRPGDTVDALRAFSPTPATTEE